MKEAVKEELSRAELPASWAHEHQQPAVAKATGHCAGQRVQWPFNVRCGGWVSQWREDRLWGWNGCHWKSIALDLGVEMKKQGRTCINTWWEYVLGYAGGGGSAAKNTVPTLKAHLPLLWPSGPRRIRHSSICPKDENIILTSFSPYFFETIPMKSFLSSTAALGWKENSYSVKPKQLWSYESGRYISH